ncbi:hypothetical protein D3C80_1145900 [compost metagenome]
MGGNLALTEVPVQFGEGLGHQHLALVAGPGVALGVGSRGVFQPVLQLFQPGIAPGVEFLGDADGVLDHDGDTAGVGLAGSGLEHLLRGNPGDHLRAAEELGVEQFAQGRVAFGGEVDHRVELVVGQHMGGGDGAGGSGVLADVEGGQAVAPAQQLLLRCQGQRVGAVEQPQFVQVVEVVDIERPGDLASCILGTEGRGWWGMGEAGLGQGKQAVGGDAVGRVPGVAAGGLAFFEDIEKALAQGADGIAGVLQFADLVRVVQVRWQLGQLLALAVVATDDGVAQGQEGESAGAGDGGAVVEGFAQLFTELAIDGEDFIQAEHEASLSMRGTRHEP